MAITSYDLLAYDKKKTKKDVKSPYCVNDRVQFVSRVTEKKFMHKQRLDYVSSFPLAVNIYKANSGDITLRNPKKKNKKSVLTLTNDRNNGSQKCTVSDINDSEYFSNTESTKARMKKRTSVKNVRKARTKNRDNRSCSQLNIINNGTANILGDYKRTSNIPQQKRKSISHLESKENNLGTAPHDVWGILRNMNRFQFVTSPPMSEDSEVLLKKKKKGKTLKKKFNCEDATTRVIETEEFAYISSYSVGESSPTLSESTSIDRVTVINKRDEFSKICKAFEQRFLKPEEGNSSVTKTNFKRKSCALKKKKGANKASNCGDIKELAESVSQHDSDISFTFSEEKDNQVLATRNTENIPVEIKSSRDSQLPPCRTVDLANEVNTTGSPDIENVGLMNGDEKSENQSKAKNTVQLPISKRVPQLKGMFCKGVKDNAPTVTLKNNDLEKKPCLATGMPRTLPKFSKFELKRKVAALRFPIIILGKEQIRPPLFTENSTFDQFSGMDQHIWPFMMGWYDMKPVEKEQTVDQQNERPSRWSRHIESKGGVGNINRKPRRNNNSNMRDNFQNKKTIQREVRTNLTKDKFNAKKSVEPVERIDNNKCQLIDSASIVRQDEKFETTPPKRYRPMAQIKEKMLNLFQKLDKHLDYEANEISPRNKIQTPNYNSEQREFSNTTVKKPYAATFKPRTPINSDAPKDKIYNSAGFGHPWAKAKLASDFIENVIKNIKSGVYYTQDKPCIGAEMIPSLPAIPTQELSNIPTPDHELKVTITKKNPETYDPIPGFDCALPAFEIKTLNKNQISVKHRMSNVTMQFDVSVLVQARQIFMTPKAPITLIPLNAIGGQTKIFKCDTKIKNSILPAELCSILPKMLRQLNLSVSNLDKPVVNFPQPIGPIGQELSSVPDFEQLTQNLYNTITLFELMSPRIKEILTGVFPIVKKKVKAKQVNPSIGYDHLMLEMLPKIFFNYTDIAYHKIRDLVPRYPNIAIQEITVSNEVKPILPIAPEERCSELQLYTDVKTSLISTFYAYGFATILNILKTQILGGTDCKRNVNIMGIKYDGRLIDIQMKIFDSHGNSMGLSNLKIDTQVCKNDKGDFMFHNDDKFNSVKCIENNRNSTNTDNDKRRTKTGVKFIPKKRMRFHRLYKKCKSLTPATVPEKTTPINKIVSMADFLKVIGTNGTISSVFDDYSERKVLTSLKQMQHWTSELNAVQALLVLLLTNKKETTNVVRYRSLILQGIAVNRITRASELELEIEVIERENLNKILPQYEGISYLPESPDNRNQLLEELYWIAKTTASDYQKPFDESSEKHLKQLLEKRKNLNPSYLRVMARYVGLGLLKTPSKK